MSRRDGNKIDSFLGTFFAAVPLLALALLSALSFNALGQSGSGFLYLSDQRVITLEVVDQQRAVLNYINLGESYSVFQPGNLVVFSDQGEWQRTQVIRNEDLSTAENRFLARSLIKPGEVLGVDLLGDLEMNGEVSGACLRIDGRILLFEKLLSRDFEVAISRISNLDLERRNRKNALQRAGFQRGFGKMIFEGTPSAVDYQKYFQEDPVYGPVALVEPKPLLPSSFRDLPDPVLVQIGGTVSRAGGLRDARVIAGIDPALDELALETVRSSWQFLPAVQGTEVAEAEVKLNIVFRRE